MIKVNALRDTCPVPVVKTKEAIKQLNGSGEVEVLVDNEISVQNLEKMAEQKGYEVHSSKIAENKYQVLLTIGDVKNSACKEGKGIVVISSAQMGSGNDELGSVLMKGFIYAIAQQEQLPESMIFYNGGATLTCEGSTCLEDLKVLESQGVEILTCGTCLNYYDLTEKLQAGSVTNMYVIAEKMSEAERIIKP